MLAKANNTKKCASTIGKSLWPSALKPFCVCFVCFLQFCQLELVRVFLTSLLACHLGPLSGFSELNMTGAFVSVRWND